MRPLSRSTMSFCCYCRHCALNMTALGHKLLCNYSAVTRGWPICLEQRSCCISSYYVVVTRWGAAVPRVCGAWMRLHGISVASGKVTTRLSILSPRLLSNIYCCVTDPWYTRGYNKEKWGVHRDNALFPASFADSASFGAVECFRVQTVSAEELNVSMMDQLLAQMTPKETSQGAKMYQITSCYYA